MRVVVAGGTGAIGQPLVRQLQKAGHETHVFSRRPSGGETPGGAKLHRVDVLDATAVHETLRHLQPDVVVSQVTNLPKTFSPRKLSRFYAANNKVRYEGTSNLLEAAMRCGASGFVAQSSGFWYKPSPGPVKTERDPLWTDAPEPIGEAVRTMVRTEQRVADAKGLRTVLLRYGTLYGPGTWFSPDGEVGARLRKRQYPIIGDGAGTTSFIHIEDAAAATVAAIEGSQTGVFNVTDDEPARMREWLPELAQAVGGKPPPRVPAWLARLAIGRALVEWTVNMRGADNGRARSLLRWNPRFPSWRDGFRNGLAPAERAPASAPVLKR